MKLLVVFRYGPAQDKAASDRNDPGPKVEKLCIILIGNTETLYTPFLPKQGCTR